MSTPPSPLASAPDDAVAVVDRDGSWTYAQLRARVARMSAALDARGVRPRDAVLIVAANERESMAAYHAVVGRGAAAVLTHVTSGAGEIHYAFETTGAVLAIVSPLAAHLASAMPEGAVVVRADELDADAAPEPRDVDPDARRLVIFTSGTTSLPKGVVHSARSLAGAVASFAAMTGITASDKFFLVSPISSITGVAQVLELAPSAGAGAILESAFDNERSLDFLIATGGTLYGGPDLVLDRLLAAAQRRGVGVPLRLAALGGTMLRRELIDTAERFGIRVIRVYGSSEVPLSVGTRPHEPDDVRLTDEGVPGPGVEMRLSDDGSGELLIRGPHLFAGYLDPGETEAALEDGWFRTGDEARLEGGRLKIVGRLKDIASRNGKKISLAEVDQAFTTATGIVDCAAFTVQDDATGERVSVAVRLEPDASLDVPAALRAMETAGLARYKLPESVVRWPGPLPLTATGKVQRRDLSEDGDLLWRAARLSPTAAT